jgi:hypothetical protein
MYDTNKLSQCKTTYFSQYVPSFIFPYLVAILLTLYVPNGKF